MKSQDVSILGKVKLHIRVENVLRVLSIAHRVEGFRRELETWKFMGTQRS